MRSTGLLLRDDGFVGSESSRRAGHEFKVFAVIVAGLGSRRFVDEVCSDGLGPFAGEHRRANLNYRRVGVRKPQCDVVLTQGPCHRIHVEHALQIGNYRHLLVVVVVV